MSSEIDDSEDGFVCPQCDKRFQEGECMPAVALAAQIGREEDVVLCSIRCLVGFLKEHATN